MVGPATRGAATQGGGVGWLGRSELRLRILLVCDSLDIGGAERHVIGLAAALKRRGHDVTIACSQGGPLGAEVGASGIALRTLSDRLVKRRVSISYTRLLTELVSGNRFDLVHAHMHASAAAAAVACARNGVPLLITEHSEASWRDDRAWRTSRSAYRRAAHVIAVSGSIGRRLIAVDRLPARRMTAIRNAIPRAEGQSREPDPLGRRFAPGDLVIGTVARLVPEKGVASLLLAAPLVLRERPRTRFVVIGDGPLRTPLAALAEKLGIGSRVRFLGARVDGPQLIAELDVLAVPSLSNEGTPLVTLEALSAGVPVVASSVGGIPEQVHGFERVALVHPGDVVALTRALIEMLRRPASSTAPGQKILLLPGHEAMVRETEAVYAKVYAEAVRRKPRYVGALAPRWLAR
ncbi:MAG TPA: glycosyltransferase [Candidatus Limnocylindria bacterium]|nr:glycosyltransferase [Candidatus Limnocylindria bacterium]